MNVCWKFITQQWTRQYSLKSHFENFNDLLNLCVGPPISIYFHYLHSRFDIAFGLVVDLAHCVLKFYWKSLYDAVRVFEWCLCAFATRKRQKQQLVSIDNYIRVKIYCFHWIGGLTFLFNRLWHVKNVSNVSTIEAIVAFYALKMGLCVCVRASTVCSYLPRTIALTQDRKCFVFGNRLL